MFDTRDFAAIRLQMHRMFPEQEPPDLGYMVVSEIGDGEGQAVLAGGFLRDMLLGRRFKDVDIMSNRDPVGVVMTPLHEPDERYVHNDIDAVGYVDIAGMTYNFIKMRFPTTTTDTINRIDFGICKVAWSKEDGLVISNHFLLDAERRIITNYRTGWGETGVNAHYDRLRSRFNWPLIMSEGRSQFSGAS